MENIYSNQNAHADDHILKLYLVTVRFVVAAYCYIWNPQLEVITGPIFKNWCLMWLFILDREVCKQYTGCIWGNKDEHMPKCMEVREVYGWPRITEQTIIDPTGYSQQPNGSTTNSKTVHTAASAPDNKHLVSQYFIFYTDCTYNTVVSSV